MKKIDLRKLIRILLNIATVLAAVITIYDYLSVGFKMVWSFLTIEIDSFYLVMAGIAISLILININKISPLGRKYSKLFNLAKLPENLSKAVTVEIDPQWYEPLVRIIVNPDPTETPTHLCFNLRTVNRTYHSFRPEKVLIKCVCGDVECSDSWDRETRHSKLIERPTKIPNEGDGQIKFYAPLTNFKDVKQTNLGIWNLHGTAIYKSVQPLIGTDEYATIEMEFDIECALYDERIKLVKQVMEQLDKNGNGE
ncbi:MAG: hypothetical protein SVY15_04165 [Halobacteriota archaeon]|nr:hypothetical protein [Halobacteriota archaeon]